MHLVFPRCSCELFLVCPALFDLGHGARQEPRKKGCYFAFIGGSLYQYLCLNFKMSSSVLLLVAIMLDPTAKLYSVDVISADGK